MSETLVWRLELECGHTRLDGPWPAPAVERVHWVGEVAFCEVCPRVVSPEDGHPVLRLRRVVDVDTVNGAAHREPSADVEREYQAQCTAERDAWRVEEAP